MTKNKILMKILTLLTFLFLVSCTPASWDNSSPIDAKKETTVEIQNNIIDSCATISLVNNDVYILKDNVVYKKLHTSSENTISISPVVIYILMFLCILFGIFIHWVSVV